MKMIVVLLIVFLAHSSYAGYGKTFRQCKRLYGKPIKKDIDGKTRYYRYKDRDYDIVLIFLDGKVEGFSYGRLDGFPISQSEIRRILSTVDRGHWQEIIPGTWINGDLIALYYDGRIAYQSPKLVRYISNRRK